MTQDDCDRYLTGRRQRKDRAGAVIGTLDESVARVAAAVIIELACYRELLTADRYRDGLTPWNGRSSSQVAGMRPPAENKTPVAGQRILQPALAAALYLTTALGPHLAALPPQVQQRRRDNARLGEAAVDPGRLQQVLRHHAETGLPLEAVRDVSARARLRQGWDPADPLLTSASPRWPARRGRAGSGLLLTAARPLIEQTLALVGTVKPWGPPGERRVPR